MISVTLHGYGQNRFILKGKITEQKSSAVIAYANLFDSIQNIYAATDSNGHFEIQLNEGKYSFEISSVGYQTIFKEINLIKNTELKIELKQDIQLDEIVVSSDKINKTAQNNSSGMTTLSSMSVERLPAFLGEKDIMKAVLLTPGIQSGQEGARGIFVRGGSPDQNLVLFHHAPIYNVAHIYNFLSVFTLESISKMDIHKSYIPVQFGGRLSAVLDIEPNFGNTDSWKGDYSISFITQKFHIEGPIKKNKTSFNFSIRDCHAGLFLYPLSKKQYKSASGNEGSIAYYFFDMNAAIKHQVNEKNTFSWSFYVGQDFYNFTELKVTNTTKKTEKRSTDKRLKWMNAVNTLEWNTKFKKLNISNFYNFSWYQLNPKQYLGLEQIKQPSGDKTNTSTDYFTKSRIMEHGWQTNIEHTINKMHLLNYGFKISDRNFLINKVNYTVRDTLGNVVDEKEFKNPTVNAIDFYAYADYLFTWKDKLELKGGLQLFTYTASKKAFFYALPRAEIIYHPIVGMSMRASAGYSVQPLHLLTNNTGDIQNDVWVPATKNIAPETAWQVSGGVQYDHPKGYSASIDGYYKKMDHLTDYKFGTTFLSDRIPWETQMINTGKGEAYGLEVFFAKTKGQFTAWCKYNLGWSTRQFPELNQGKPFFYKYDRRHDVSFVLQYKLKKHFDFSIAWTYGTGWRMTTPTSSYASDLTIVSYDQANIPLVGTQAMITNWNERNNYILPAYHHLDIGMNYTKDAKRVQHILNVSVYNVYNNFNIFTVYQDGDTDIDGNKYKKYVKLSIFPILPSIGYSVKFQLKKDKNQPTEK
ncbi:MAG TPA: carboxypeptidase-like regulatory domain-containing protein [Chitinophagales bacterium]|nr:carboxypeptidase-like regulatory domain-containing protein [Chitinophagales bacterium]